MKIGIVSGSHREFRLVNNQYNSERHELIKITKAEDIDGHVFDLFIFGPDHNLIKPVTFHHIVNKIAAYYEKEKEEPYNPFN